MERVPEPQLMEESEQAAQYAAGDFDEPHGAIVAQFAARYDGDAIREILDIGCGPGDISCRFARLCRGAMVVGVDGSAAMLSHTGTMMARHGVDPARFEFIRDTIPDARIPARDYQLVLSTSLLHHLPDPLVLWRTIRQVAPHGAIIFVADLVRPRSPRAAREIVDTYSGNEPEILKRDFYNSLLAAFRPEEVEGQLAEAGIGGLSVEMTTDRHMIVHGMVEDA